MQLQKYQQEGLTKVEAAERIQLEALKLSNEKLTAQRKQATINIKNLNTELEKEQLLMTKGADAVARFELELKGG